jgi:hypothetical protein
MPAETASSTRTIIPLLDEGTIVSRPTQGVPLGDDLYRVLATPDDDPEDEHWEFPPGRVVRCVEEVRGSKTLLIARTLVSSLD